MRFYIKQKVFSIGDKFNVFDENQNVIYRVEGKVFSISNRLAFIDQNETVLYNAQRKVFSFLPQYFIYDRSERQVSMIKRHFSFFGSKFTLTINGRPMQITGSVFAHSFVIEDQGMPIVNIQKKYFSWGDTYEISIDSEKDLELLLFAVIILDQTLHEGGSSSSHHH